MEPAELTIEQALVRLAKELSNRNGESLTIRVTEPERPLSLKELAQLINQYSAEVGQYLDNEASRHKRRSDELMAAYNALQNQTDAMNKELAMARRIQQKLLPQPSEMPNRPELQAAGFYASMSNIGGDLYDIVRIGRNAYGVLIADVSGHGIPAALVTSLVKISFRTKLRWGAKTNEVCQAVSEELYPILSDLDYYASAFFAIFDLEQGTLSYTNCGHHTGILLREGADQPLKLDSKGRFLGIFQDTSYETLCLDLEARDVLFLYTDGITEARSLLDEEYTPERLLAHLGKVGPLPPDDLLKSVYRDLDNFCMGAEARDDQSMFAVQFLSKTDSIDHQQAQSSEPLHDIDAELAWLEGVGATDLSRRIAQGLRQSMVRHDWETVLAILRTLEIGGIANGLHLHLLATILFRAGRFSQAKEAARRGLAANDLNADTRQRLEALLGAVPAD